MRRTLPYPSAESLGRLFNDAELLDCMPGITVEEGSQDITLHVDLERVLPQTEDTPTMNEKVGNFLSNVRSFIYFDYDDARDGVLSLAYWGDRGAGANIHDQFQRWLNVDAIDEVLGHHTLRAMAYPFNADMRDYVRKDWTYNKSLNATQVGIGGFTFGLVVRNDEFGINEYGDDGERYGRVMWRWLDLSTIGSCACWGVSGTERDRLLVGEGRNYLYDMQPHNVDGPVQSLSLVLGAATLAYSAAQYEGREDVLSTAEWR